MTGAVVALVGFFAALVAIPVIAYAGPRLLRPRVKLPRLANVRVDGCPYELLAVTKLIEDFLDEWRERFGAAQASKIREAWKLLDIYFIPKTFYVGKLLVTGVTDKPTKLRVACIHPDDVRRTALGHELIHSALWVLNSEPDPDHIDKFYKGWTAEHDALERALKS